jgi:ABC-type phosphate transport system substrate-binding protein
VIDSMQPRDSAAPPAARRQTWPRLFAAAARLLAVAAVVVAAAAPPCPALAAEPFVVIAHPSVPGTAMHRADLAAVFLKKAVRWGDGTFATPIDQSGTSSVRQAFSETVFQMPVVAVLQYWQKQLLTSTTPVRVPVVKSSDDEVLAAVAATSGSVGYVSTATPLPASVKAVKLVD